MPGLENSPDGRQVLMALQEAFSTGFRSLYPTIRGQLRLLLELLQSRSHPDLTRVIANQIAGVKSWGALFKEVEGLADILQTLLKFSTASDAQLRSDKQTQTPPFTKT